MATTLLDDKPQVITIKEIYDKCISLETKVDMQKEINKNTSVQFRFLAYFIISIEVVNFVLNIWILRG